MLQGLQSSNQHATQDNYLFGEVFFITQTHAEWE